MNIENKEPKILSNRSLSRFQVILMSVAAGTSVANIYYNQPILKEISSTFNINETRAGLISILSQVGYGIGLFFITPLGDKINKKKLIIALQVLLFISLFLIAFSENIVQVWVLSVMISIFSVSVQVIMPMAAGLDRKSRGKTVGTIFTGILIGILAARVFSGSIAEWFGWRYVYGISACAILIMVILMKLSLPEVENHFEGSYIKLLSSALHQIKRFRLLRSISAIGALQFGMFSSFWTTLTFHLSGAPFYFHSDIIGLFGLVAIAGALMAPVLGKRTDKGDSRWVRFSAIGIIIFSILMMMLITDSVVVLIVGVLLLDIGVQAMQVTNVALIYTLDETSHSRINTIFMTSVFVGGALGTLVGVICWQLGGWLGVTTQMLLWSLFVLLILLKEMKDKSTI
jgi:predicted MFS family arabinose efflux permease